MDFLYKTNLIIILISCFLNFFFIILAKKGTSLLITDHLHEGPQKFYENPDPIIGFLGDSTRTMHLKMKLRIM